MVGFLTVFSNVSLSDFLKDSISFSDILHSLDYMKLLDLKYDN